MPKMIKCAKPKKPKKPPPPPLLGPVDHQERWRVNSRRRSGTKIETLWRHMLKTESFTVPGLAGLRIVSKNYVKVYLRILAAAGYLTRRFPYGERNPHFPALYSVGPHYRGLVAPQLAGGAGGGGRLGAGWKTLEKKGEKK